MGGGVSVCWSRSSGNDASKICRQGGSDRPSSKIDEEPHSRLPRSGKFGNMDHRMNTDHSVRLYIDMGGRPC